MKPTKFLDLFKSARKVGTPLIGVQTPDPAATINAIGTVHKGPIVVWDIVQGWTAFNKEGTDAIGEVMAARGGGDSDVSSATRDAVESLQCAVSLPPGSILCVHQAQRMIESPGGMGAAVVQGIWNLRDRYKSDERTLVLLAPQFQLPGDLANDILVLDEPLPTEVELATIVKELAEAAQVKVDQKTTMRAVELLRGLAAFPAEQSVALSLSKAGLNLDLLGERKRKMIENTPGLSVWEGGDKLDDVGGCDTIKKYIRLFLKGAESPLTVVFIDEIEKSMAGATGVGDSSGVSQGQLQVMLTYMQDNNASGLIFIGPPGAGKTAVAKAIGGEAGIPTIAFDLNGMKSSLVGSSEERMRNAMKVVTAVGGNRVLFVATCNKISNLPPELRRRFTMGTFFFDLPDKEERKVIWDMYVKKFKLPEQPLPESSVWTGAEIRQACLLSYRLGIPLVETPQFIVPVAKSAQEEIESLRKQANGRFLSASKSGLYQSAVVAPSGAPGAKRAVNVGN